MQAAKADAERQRKVMGKLAVAAAMRIRSGNPDTANPIADSFDVEGGTKSFEDEK